MGAEVLCFTPDYDFSLSSTTAYSRVLLSLFDKLKITVTLQGHTAKNEGHDGYKKLFLLAIANRMCRLLWIRLGAHMHKLELWTLQRERPGGMHLPLGSIYPHSVNREYSVQLRSCQKNHF